MEPIKLIVYGEATPAGSKTARVVYRKGKNGQRVPVRKNGQIVVATYDANAKKLEPWRDKIASQVRGQYDGPLLEGALVVEMTFHRHRPKGHYGTGRNAGLVKDAAPAAPTTMPDVLKLARAVEDELTGLVWTDDSHTIDLLVSKRYCGLDERPRVEIVVCESEVQVVSDLVARGLVAPTKPKFEQLELAIAA